jgi:hypothetical protein
MLKKTLLSALLTASAFISAQVGLDISLTLNQDTENAITGAIVVDENVTTSIVFNGLEAMVVNLLVTTEGDVVSIVTQFFQKTDAEGAESDVTPITDQLPVQVLFGQPATVTINDEDSSNSLTLTMIPTLVESASDDVADVADEYSAAE